MLINSHHRNPDKNKRYSVYNIRFSDTLDHLQHRKINDKFQHQTRRTLIRDHARSQIL